MKSVNSENSDPNLPISSTPTQKPTKTPLLKSSTKHTKTIPSLPQQQNKKFIIAKKKNPRKGDQKTNDFDTKKCREGAYESLRASHEDFFKNNCDGSDSKAGDNEVVRSLVIDEKSKDFDPSHSDSFTKDVDGSNLKGRKEKAEGKDVVIMKSLVMEPTSIGNLLGLRNLNLSKNVFSGSIPTGIGKLLDLSGQKNLSGRVNLIGEHKDYEGYSVLPMATRQDTIISIKKRNQKGDAKLVLRIGNVNDKYSMCIYSADPSQEVDLKNH